MGLRERIAALIGQDLLVLEALEHAEHAASRLLGRSEIADARLVGGGFLRARKREEGALCDLLAAHQDRRAGVARARRHRGNAEHHRQDQRNR